MDLTDFNSAIRYWHIADILVAAHMSAIGVKRTSRVTAANLGGLYPRTNSVAAIRFANAVLDCVVRRTPTASSNRVIQFSPAVSIMPDDGSAICISPPLVISVIVVPTAIRVNRSQDDHNNIVQRRSRQSPTETHLPTASIQGSSSCPPSLKEPRAWEVTRLFRPPAKVAAHYLDFGVVSSFSGFAMLLPEPVDWALDFIALELMALA